MNQTRKDLDSKLVLRKTVNITSNRGTEFNNDFFKDADVIIPDGKVIADNLETKIPKQKESKIASLLKAVACIDLTTLCGDDCESRVRQLCQKASNPIKKSVLSDLGYDGTDVKVAAVCVYPLMVPYCVDEFKQLGVDIAVASVAAGFPCGLTPMSARLAEIKYAVDAGATEIDIVINRSLVISGNYKQLYDEVSEMKKACGEGVHMKTILSVGELGSLENVYKTSMVCMMAGTDFIKTSTGKEAVNANFPCGTVMARAIQDYKAATGYQVGFKPAGGIRTTKDALMWQVLMQEELGDDWLSPELFRIGASGLLNEIEKELSSYASR